MTKFLFLIILLFIFEVPAFSQVLHLYGGQNHDEYLGCLNCSIYDQSSIWNEYGTYGSKYNSYSPWNAYSATPPVVVDKQGNFYGYFTVNEYKSKRADFELALLIYEYHELIRENVRKWYTKIFEE